MTFEHYIALFITMFVVAIVPGPAFLAIASASATEGFKRGIYMTSGLLLADYVFIILALSGLSYVAELLGEAFVLIKYLCAAYLLWIGLSLILAKATNTTEQAPEKSKHTAILAGFLLTLSNPKAIIFYVALFPAFVDINSITLIDTLGIMICATLAFGSVNITLAYTTAKASQYVCSSSKSGIMQKCAGLVMAGTGLTVAARA
ncbi:LysE family translocator [Litorilituus sediminis]|uniref:LysE family translocator n=1 Tax=Litorilituus sediminis TaxID=718192 RepID=A0A4P6P647_9GAMM|nr:LysE family translocator [Litorilituus sediminis]QBG36488.1 LysE family translocator [Litorilituus sediminis]